MKSNLTLTLKYLTLSLLGASITASKGDLIDFHFGGLNQTGPAVIGSANDVWNMTTYSRGGPVTLKNVQGQTTPVTVTWDSGNAGGSTEIVAANIAATSMNSATSWLMRSCIASYQYGSGYTNLKVTLNGLTPNQAYSLVLLGAGNVQKEGTLFTVTGTGTFNGATSGVDRRLSQGTGDAYVTLDVVSSPQGTLQVLTKQNGYHYGFMNGFQLVEASTTPAPEAQISPAAAATVPTAPASTPAAAPAAASMAWGINGHPTWTDYSNYIPANTTAQINYLNELGCKYYRCSFEGANYASILGVVVPQAQAAGITVLPDLAVSLIPTASAQSNYQTNYQTANSWATYAISKGYALPYWEIGNEVENWGLVSVTYDGASPNDYPDVKPGGFVAIASGLSGAYQGIKDAYTAGRASGLTTITPKVLFGATYRHWGLLAKIQAYNGSLPCDMISWHWYGPNYGLFNQPIVDAQSVSNGRTPAQCLNDFKSKTNPSQPMSIWITETDRSALVNGQYQNGSATSTSAPKTNQDWAAQAAAIQTNIDSFKTVPSVTGIFVYELLDDTQMDAGNTAELASEGYFGLVTGLNGTRKNAFYTFQTEIKGK